MGGSISGSVLLWFWSHIAREHSGRVLSSILWLLQVTKDLDLTLGPRAFGFDATMFFVILRALFSGVRVTYYGTLSAGITNTNIGWLKDFAVLVKSNQSGTLTPHTFLHSYCQWRMKTKLRIRGRLFKRPRNTIATAIVVSLGISIVLEIVGFGGNLLSGLSVYRSEEDCVCFLGRSIWLRFLSKNRYRNS